MKNGLSIKLLLTIKMEGLLSFEEAAQRLGKRRTSIYYLLRRNGLHIIRIERRPFLLEFEVEALGSAALTTSKKL